MENHVLKIALVRDETKLDDDKPKIKKKKMNNKREAEGKGGEVKEEAEKNKEIVKKKK